MSKTVPNYRFNLKWCILGKMQPNDTVYCQKEINLVEFRSITKISSHELAWLYIHNFYYFKLSFLLYIIEAAFIFFFTNQMESKVVVVRWFCQHAPDQSLVSHIYFHHKETYRYSSNVRNPEHKGYDHTNHT